jgi:hypothetical protein
MPSPRVVTQNWFPILSCSSSSFKRDTRSSTSGRSPGASSPRRHSSMMRIFSSAEKCRLVALRMSLTVTSALCGARLLRCLIVSLVGLTMSRTLSLAQSAQSGRS